MSINPSLMTTAQALAIAVLKGELAAALALADRLKEEYEATYDAVRGAAETINKNSYPLAEDGYSVYQWPEFRAFCKRAGIIWDLRTVDMIITIREGALPIVEHRYALSDTAPDTPAVNELPEDSP